MSYARWGTVIEPGAEPSDVYVFDVGRSLECCGCSLKGRSFRMPSIELAREHFAAHEANGDSCGQPWAEMLAEIERDADAIWHGGLYDFEKGASDG